MAGDTEGSYKGVTDVFKNVEATAMYGGATKKIDVNSDPRPGYYFSPITFQPRLGGYQMDLKGKLLELQLMFKSQLKMWKVRQY